MSFKEKSTPAQNRLAVSEGQRIFRELRESFPDNSVDHFDAMLNTLCI